MTQRSLVVLVTLFALSIGAASQVQCVRCRFDAVTCNGEQGSADAGNPCPDACICGLQSRASFLDSLQPGFLVIQQQGKMIVSSVLPNSPASAAGIRIGDQLLRINGSEPYGRDCNMANWGSLEQPTVTILTIRRDSGFSRVVPIQLQSVRQYLNASLITARARANFKPASQRSHDVPAVGTFTLGLEGDLLGGSLVVRSVLKNSPAHRAGISPGDSILEINGHSLSESDLIYLKDLTGRDQLTVKVRTTYGARSIELQAEGVSEILRRLSDDMPTATQETSASL
jgi:S1-C subfamily serine protease